MTNPLEKAFGFTADDLATNQNGDLSRSQFERLHHLHQQCRQEIIMIFLVGIIVVIGSVLFAFIVERGWLLLIFPIIFLMMAARRFPRLRRTYRAWESTFLHEHVHTLDAVSVSDFEALYLPTKEPICYVFKRENLNLQLSPAQYSALKADCTYRFYYFPAADDNGNHIILAIE